MHMSLFVFRPCNIDMTLYSKIPFDKIPTLTWHNPFLRTKIWYRLAITHKTGQKGRREQWESDQRRYFTMSLSHNTDSGCNFVTLKAQVRELSLEWNHGVS